MERTRSAQSRVEEYLRAESRLSSIDKPKPLDDESKSKYCWRLIRESVRHATEIVKKADVKDLVITHGVHHNRTLRHPLPIVDMLYNKHTKKYLSVDGRMIRVFEPDGRKKDIVAEPEPFQRLMYAAQVNLYVGWSPGDDRLILMNDEFELQSVSKAHGPIHCAMYNDHTGEVLTIGKDFLTNWVFRYGGRHILPRRTSHDGFKADDKFEIMVLEETASRLQKLYCNVGTSVLVFNIHEGKLLVRKPETHVRPLTAMLHFNPLKYLVTAAKDGSIKVWDERWHLQLVFVGHGGAVSSLAVYPYGPNILSSSADNTIRVWSLETCDEVDQITLEQPVQSLGTQLNCDGFYSYGPDSADLWNVKHIHRLHTRISHSVSQMKTTDHPEHPVRTLLLCKDSSIRVMSPASGEVITTLLVNTRRCLVDAAYAIAEDTLFAVFGDGTIVKSATCSNPCTVLEEWSCPDTSKACNYLLVYEYVITSSVASDTWGGLRRATINGGLQTPTNDNRKSKNANRTLLLGGRKDGYICVYNWDTGEVDFKIEAHGSKGVLNMIANSKADQLISAGLDNIIKIWRLYPYAQESLAPLMSFFCAHSPIYMTVLKTKLVVAFQEPTSATYSTVMYNLHSKDRRDHGPEDDHTDNITGLSACQKMKILASCSTDGTVRIWDDSNALIRIIKLSAVPHSLTFCSDKGDILVGIGDHVHRIDHKQFLPSAYRLRMVSMQFRMPLEEKPLPLDENILLAMSREDVKRLKAARSSFKFTHFVDVLTKDENDEVSREKRIREQAFAELDARDVELEKIRDGDLPAQKKPKSTNVTKREAFDKYLSIFYNRTFITLPKEDRFPNDTVTEALEGPSKTNTRVTFQEEKEPTGFFPSPSAAVTAAPPPVTTSDVETTPSSMTLPQTPATPIRPGGFVPNSVLVRLLWPQEAREAENKKKDEAYRPPQISEAQLAQIASMQRKGTETGSFRDRTIVLDYDDDESRKDPEEDETTLNSGPSSKEPSSFLSKMQDIMTKPPTPRESPEPEPEAPGGPLSKDNTLSRGQTQTEADDSQTGKETPKAKRVVFKPKLPNKFLARPLAPRTPVESAGPARERTPTPPPTPLPEFITQFKGADWFDKYFPKCNENTMPKPWSGQAFALMLARLLRVTDYPEKVEVAQAILAVHRDTRLSDSEPFSAAIYGVLHHRITAPSCSDPHQKAFIRAALELLHELGCNDKAFYQELLVQFLDGDREIRNQVQDILCSRGLKDPHNYLPKELDSWDVWNIDDDNRAGELGKMCSQWLDKWMTGFKLHVEDTIDRLKKGQNVRGRATPTQLRNQKAVVRKPTVGSIVEDETESEGSGPGDEAAGKTVTVTFDKAPSTDTVEGATYMEALNYFCEMELEKYLDRIRGGGQGSSNNKSDAHKNTVLVLPKIAGKPTLVRLGETHTSKCRPSRETSLAAELCLPPIMTRGRISDPGQLNGFPTSINLPMKSVVMNPFPSAIDDFTEKQQPILLMLKTSQKYFVPSRSYFETQDA